MLYSSKQPLKKNPGRSRNDLFASTRGPGRGHIIAKLCAGKLDGGLLLYIYIFRFLEAKS